MAVQPILSTDTLETGFRQKYNTTINEIIVSYSLLTDNTGAFTKILRLVKFGGGFINIDLSQIFYTKQEIAQLITGINSSPYSGEWDSSKTYASKSVVDYEGTLWRSNIAGNTDEPGTTLTWDNILSVPSLVKTKLNTTWDASTQTITYTYSGSDSTYLGANEVLTSLYRIDSGTGKSYPLSGFSPVFGHLGGDVSAPVTSISFEGVDTDLWTNGNFKIIIRPDGELGNGYNEGQQAVFSKLVDTYAEMVADGFPGDLTIYKVLSDETQGGSTTQYNVWPDGIRLLYGSGGGGSTSLRSTTDASSDFLTPTYLNANYGGYQNGEMVNLPSQGQKYTRNKDRPNGWTYGPLNDLLMRKLIYILLFISLGAHAQQTGVAPGSTPGTGQFQPKVLGSGTTARMFTSFGGNTYFELPTIKAFLDSLAAVRNSVSGVYVQRAGNSTTGSAPYFGGQLPSYYYPASNPNGYISSYTETDPTVPSYAKSLTAFSVIKSSTDPLYYSVTNPSAYISGSYTGFDTRYAFVGGSNATGTWGINITGNSATVSNGVYTTGSYANPAWITSFAYSKLTGAPTNVSTFTNDAGYLNTTTGDARYGQLGANNTWTLGNNFQGTTFVPNVTAGSNNAQAANTGYVDGAIAAFRAGNNSFSGTNSVPTPGSLIGTSGQIVNGQYVANYYAPLNAPVFTGNSFRTPGLTYIGGAAQFNLDPAASPSIPSASSPISGLFIGANRSAAQGEINLINIIGTSGSAIGGFDFRQRTTGGTETPLFNINGSTGAATLYGNLVLPVTTNTSGSYYVTYNPATQQFERVTTANAATQLGTGGGTGMVNPMTTSQDIIVGGSGGTPTRLPVGSNGQVLGVTSGAVGWVNNTATSGEPAGGGFRRSITGVAASGGGTTTYTLLSTDYTLLVECISNGTVNITLPVITSANSGQIYCIRRYGTNSSTTVQLNTSSTDKFIESTYTSNTSHVITSTSAATYVQAEFAGVTNYWVVLSN